MRMRRVKESEREEENFRDLMVYLGLNYIFFFLLNLYIYLTDSFDRRM